MTAPSYQAPRSLAEALEILADLGGEATVLAGGQDVVPQMNQGRLAPRHLVDISRLPELRRIAVADGLAPSAITLGALTTYAELGRHSGFGKPLSLFGDALRQIGGGPQIRRRGTVGGAACAAQPAYDLPACLVALHAVFVLAHHGGIRRVPASSFFLDAGQTARRPDELLTAVEIPGMPPGCTSAYAKLKFGEGGYTIAGAAAVLVLDGDGVCRDAQLVLSGVFPVPRRIPVAESALVGTRLDAAVMGTAGRGPGPLAALVAEAVVEPIEDVMAPAGYRRMAAGVMAQRAVGQAAAR